MEVKLEIELWYDPVAPLLGVYPEKKSRNVFSDRLWGPWKLMRDD